MTFNELNEILSELNYYENFKTNFLRKNYNEINYGTRLGVKKFNSFIEANDEYSYSNQIKEEKFIEWNSILTNKYSSEEELFVVCLEIFEWGNVLNGNVKTVTELYKTKKLKPYINWIKPLLLSKNTINKEQINLSSHEII